MSERGLNHNDRGILAVIVFYKCSFEESASLQSLLKSLGQCFIKVDILIVDNSPTPQSILELPVGVNYLACPENLGLANAYNRGIELAEKLGCKWLLTLDQDTALPQTFLQQLYDVLGEVGGDPSVGAIVPQIVANGSNVSPHYFLYGGLARYFPLGYKGLPLERTYAFNSASLVRVDAARRVGGYNPYFWMDCSDLNMFHTLGQSGLRTYVNGATIVDHDFSMMKLAEKVSPWRYEQILLADAAFWGTKMNWLANLERTVGLMRRFAVHIVRRDSWVLKAITLRFLLIRLFRSRKYRKRMFQNSVERHLGTKLSATALQLRPIKVSVCMAAYNGGQFIEAQLRSILMQLREHDEVVIVDDASKDNTVDRILAMEDDRILLFRHEKNAGVIATFEEAIRRSTGDILFLSDNDDIWAPNKVDLFLAEFANDPKVIVATSALSLIDSNSVSFEEPRFTRNGKFYSGFLRNIVKNSYQGSTMAFRSSLIGDILPIPQGRGFLHDVWIGTVNERMGGKTAFIPKPLLLYRRHGSNFSDRLARWEQIRSRLWLLCEHLRHQISR
jgi:glycosyltransferase involved in cell wall biosynthesis